MTSGKLLRQLIKSGVQGDVAGFRVASEAVIKEEREKNHHLPLPALGARTPFQAMKDVYENNKNLFQKRIYNHPGLDIAWFHLVLLITRLKDNDTRLWYAHKAIAEGWSRATLEVNLRNRLHERIGQAVTNFSARLPAAQSQLAVETLKDPYLFDFLGLGDEAHEREIENALVRHITRFLLELALTGIDKPVGVAEYQLVRALPENLATSLPTVEALENELAAIEEKPAKGDDA